VYGNFESKEEICAEAFDYLLKKVSADIAAKTSAKTSPKEKLIALLGYYRGSMTKEGEYGCPLLNFGTEADDTNPVIKQKVNKAITLMQNYIAQLVRSGIEAGEFNKSFDASLFAVKAFSMIEGAILISRIQNSTKHMRLITEILEKEIEDNSM
jgi:hypothetical protein